MHGQIDLARVQGVFKFLRENPFSADFGQGLIDHAVAGRRHVHDLDGQIGKVRDQLIAHVVSLPQRKLAAAGANA